MSSPEVTKVTAVITVITVTLIDLSFSPLCPPYSVQVGAMVRGLLPALEESNRRTRGKESDDESGLCSTDIHRYPSIFINIHRYP